MEDIKRLVVATGRGYRWMLMWGGLIHRSCHQVYLIVRLRTIATQKLRYPKMITRHVLSEFTEPVLNDRKMCHC